ncbi:hypothetical protein TELCIR_09581 [Teladorsagia circumcincta]|uniref:Uncharacterized protein n=1 Tax=Teladorsagia circumcincta TaxID=45464 RepID=A0A2G9UEN3_TELCI|nr:hypothetical protein TELCIR_09581 [Teladorsagia circumcincta]
MRTLAGVSLRKSSTKTWAKYQQRCQLCFQPKRHFPEADSIMGIEMAAYSVHCIANPLIAVIRDRRLESTLAHILMRNKRHTPDQELIVALMRDPPPPYST